MRRHGILHFKISGVMQDAKGNYTYNLGEPRNEEVMGADRFHGFKVTPQPAFIEGEITDKEDLDVAAILKVADETITLEKRNGKMVVLKKASFAGEGNMQTEEGNLAVRFVGESAEEI